MLCAGQSSIGADTSQLLKSPKRLLGTSVPSRNLLDPPRIAQHKFSCKHPRLIPPGGGHPYIAETADSKPPSGSLGKRGPARVPARDKCAHRQCQYAFTTQVA
jgi:hypothetical protein